jgi:hypothetical protein
MVPATVASQLDDPLRESWGTYIGGARRACARHMANKADGGLRPGANYHKESGNRDEASHLALRSRNRTGKRAAARFQSTLVKRFDNQLIVLVAHDAACGLTRSSDRCLLLPCRICDLADVSWGVSKVQHFALCISRRFIVDKSIRI